MFRHVETIMRSKGIDFICLIAGIDNIPAQKLYESLGFEEEKGYFKKIQ